MIYGYTYCNEKEFAIPADGLATKGRQINLVTLCTEKRYEECKEKRECEWGFDFCGEIRKERFKHCCLKGIFLQKVDKKRRKME
jgi:hypothetical protein